MNYACCVQYDTDTGENNQMFQSYFTGGRSITKFIRSKHLVFVDFDKIILSRFQRITRKDIFVVFQPNGLQQQMNQRLADSLRRKCSEKRVRRFADLPNTEEFLNTVYPISGDFVWERVSRSVCYYVFDHLTTEMDEFEKITFQPKTVL